jgi:NADH-quinone oxidoreductase subunit G
MSMVSLTIDGKKVKVPAGTTLLEAAKEANIHIPTLCYLPEVQAIGACRVCLVEIEGNRSLQASCVFPVGEGLVVHTNSRKVQQARKFTVEMLLSAHPQDCLICVKNRKCELQKLSEELGIREIRFQGEKPKGRIDDSNPSVVRDSSKCILCRRCVTVCQEIQQVGALSPQERGFDTYIGPAFGDEMGEVSCALCGQCINVCPVGALSERDYTAEVWKAIHDPDKIVIAQDAPAVRAALGEEFGLPTGTLVTGKMLEALRRLGFDVIFDTNFAADLTIIEEGNELLKRVKEGGTLPMITSCSPGWIKYIEHFYPQLLPHLSTCKSPHQMLGALAKTYYAAKTERDPAKMVTVSIMPCTAKKFESSRPEMNDSGFRDVDYVLTTRELARMIKAAGIDFVNLPDGKYDDPLGEYTGAATIFGATGGVMEAALRTVYEVVTGKKLENVEFMAVRGLEGVKEATVPIDGLGDVRVAVAHGLGNARKLMDRLAAGKANYHFIEVMACPGGCVAGGGQPIPVNDEIRRLRAAALYREDKGLIRKSHENPSITKIYKEFLKEPLGEKSHHLLHTKYTARGKYPKHQ